MKSNVLYLGDTAINQQASYLAGIMSYYDISFDYISSDEKFSLEKLGQDTRLIIISDYPSANFTASQIDAIVERVKGGMGILMIGGWESFTGLGGDYGKTKLSEVLPVRIKDSDDRINQSDPCLVKKEIDHEILEGLDLENAVPVIGGFNDVEAKDGATTILSSQRFRAYHRGNGFEFSPYKTAPLLVVGEFGLGKTAAFASDVAPHWVGPFVDWGSSRVTAQADGAEAIEVGDSYALFFKNLIQWLCGQS